MYVSKEPVLKTILHSLCIFKYCSVVLDLVFVSTYVSKKIQYYTFTHDLFTFNVFFFVLDVSLMFEMSLFFFFYYYYFSSLFHLVLLPFALTLIMHTLKDILH